MRIILLYKNNNTDINKRNCYLQIEIHETYRTYFSLHLNIFQHHYQTDSLKKSDISISRIFYIFSAYKINISYN